MSYGFLFRRVSLCIGGLIFLVASTAFLSCFTEQNPYYVAPQVEYADSIVCFAGVAIEPVIPRVTGKGAPEKYAVNPPFPHGLHLDSLTGIIWGTAADGPGISVHRITCCNNWGCSDSAIVTVVVRPARVRRITVSLHSSDSIAVDWDSVPGAQRYVIYRAANGSGAFDVCGTQGNAPFIDTVNRRDSSRAYFVVAFAPGIGASLPSDTVGIILLGSTGGPRIVVTAPDFTRDSSVVSATTVTITGYVETRAALLSVGARVNDVSVPVTGSTTWAITASLRAAAWNSVVLTVTDNRFVTIRDTLWIFCRSGLTAPAAPLLAQRYCTGIVLCWSRVPHCNRYILWRGNTPEELSVIGGIGGMTDTSFEDTGLAIGTSYAYAVQAYYVQNSGGFCISDTSPRSVTTRYSTMQCWQTVFDGPGDDGLLDIVSTVSGTVYVGGSSRRSATDSADIFLGSLDTTGAWLWRKTYGGTRDDGATALTVTPIGTIAVAGLTSSFGAGDRDMWLLFLTADGETTATRTYGGSGRDCAYSIAWRRSDGILLGGYQTRASLRQGYVLALRSEGVVQWERSVSPSEGCVSSVIEATDGRIAAAGYVEAHPLSKQPGRAFVGCLSPAGDMVWSFCHSGGITSMFTCISQYGGNGFVAGGTETSREPYVSRVLVTRLSADGQTVWARTGAGPNESGYGLITDSYGRVLVAGSKDSDAALYIFNGDGDSVSSRTYGGSGNDSFARIAAAADGGYLLVGMTRSFGASGTAAYIVKTDSRGNTGPLR